MFDNMMHDLWTCVNADSNNRELIKRHWPCPHLHHVHSSESERSSSNKTGNRNSHRTNNSCSSRRIDRNKEQQQHVVKKKVMCNLPLSKTTNRYHHHHEHQHEHQHTNKVDNLHSNKNKNKVGSHGSITTEGSTNKVHYVNAYSPETLQEEIHDGDYVINPDERHSMRVTLRLNYNTKQRCNKEFVNKLCSNKKTLWQHCTSNKKGQDDKANNMLKYNEVNKNAATKKENVIDGAVHPNHRSNANEKGCNTTGYAEHSHTSLATPLLAALLSEYESYNRQVKLKALQELLHKQHESASSPLQSCLLAADGDAKTITHHGLECKSNELCKTTRTKLTSDNEVHLGELGNEPFSPDSKSITNTERQTSLFSIKGGISSEEEVLSMNTAGLTCTPLTMFHEVPVVYCNETLNDKMSVHWQAPPMQPELQNNTNINKINTSVSSTTTKDVANKNDLVRSSTTSKITTSSSLLPPRPFVVPPSQTALTQTSESPPLLQEMQKHELIEKPFAPEGNVNFTHCNSNHLEDNRKDNNNSKVYHFKHEENCRGYNTYEHMRSKSNSTLEWSSSQNAIYTSTNSFSHNNSHGSVGVKVDMNGNTLSNDTQITTPFSTLLSPIMVHENKFTSALLKPSLTATVTHSSHNLFGVDNYHVTLTTSMLNEYIERKQKEIKEKEEMEEQQKKRKSDISLLAHAEKITHSKRQLHEGHNILKKQQETEQLSHHDKNNSTNNKNYTRCTHITNNSMSNQNFSVNRFESKEAHDANEMAERWIHSHHLSYTLPEMLEEISSCSSTTQSSSHTRAYSMQAISSLTESLSYMTSHEENNNLGYNHKEQTKTPMIRKTISNTHEQVHTHAEQTKNFTPSKTIAHIENNDIIQSKELKAACPSMIATRTHVSTPPLTSCIRGSTGFHPFCVYEDHTDLFLSEKYNDNTFNHNKSKCSITELSKLYERNKQEDMERVKWNIDKDAEVLETLSISTCSSCAYGAGLRGLREEATITEMYKYEVEEEQQYNKEKEHSNNNVKMCWKHLSALQRRQYENKCARIWANQHAVRAYSHHMEHHHDQYQLMMMKKNNANYNQSSCTNKSIKNDNSNNRYEVPAEEIWNCSACTRADKAVIFFRATRHVSSTNHSNNNNSNTQNSQHQEHDKFTQQNRYQQKVQINENSNLTNKGKDNNNNNKTIYNNMKKELMNAKRMRIYEWLSEVRT